MTSHHPGTFGAILLAGGRASRMGGIDKPRLVVNGMSMLDRAVTIMREVGADPIVAVGPPPEAGAPAADAAAAPGDTGAPAATAGAPADAAVADVAAAGGAPGHTASAALAREDAASVPVRWVREDPPFTGPAAAVVAALAATAADSDPDWTFVLACDLPRVDAAVRQLAHDILLLPSDTEGACLSDPSSRPQWLTAVYRTPVLRRAAASLPDAGRDKSMRALFADVAIASLPDRADSAGDIDTWEDFRRFTKENA
ncbi:hypothetical protein ET475_11455 [Microbacterium protaetiae]|uniref:MobA-like NTP transferase domain-containing protein n=1 Tax=Microbacterium protaetiae TaxID=2509458 RepID=A0A4P6EE28_9MICO|nr:NTP transferase domain-containing protein [Microbacterium protaetiae]QAY60545.1 hypothetical protein ET475_11455 [Microbacterium protaetiae]